MNDHGPQGVGAPVRRIEDHALVTGAGRFVDDAVPPGTLVAHVLRSAVGHGRFTLGGLAAARGHPGVRLVLTHPDIAHLGSLPMRNATTQPDGSRPVPPHHPVLADGVVRHVGEPLAFIVADTAAEARSAAELIEVEYRG